MLLRLNRVSLLLFNLSLGRQLVKHAVLLVVLLLFRHSHHLYLIITS
jgi:hypothetical protein